MIRNVLLSSAALAALTTAGFAADLPARVAAPAPYYAPAPLFTWTGFYIGVNAGGVFNSNNNSGFQTFTGSVPGTVTSAGIPVTFGSFNSSQLASNKGNAGFAGGGQIGYNYQFGQFVLGIEADIQGIARSNKNNAGFSTAGDLTGATFGTPGYTYHVYGPTVAQRANFFGTVRGRIGYAFDRFLVYGTGGFAYTGNNCSNSNNFGGGSSCGNGSQSFINYYTAGSTNPIVFTNTNAANLTSNSKSNYGYAVGGGVEYAFTQNLTAKVEYLYVNFNNKNNNNVYNPNGVYTNPASAGTITVAGAVPGFYSGSSKNNGLNVVRVGLNYKFGSPATAVVAKY